MEVRFGVYKHRIVYDDGLLLLRQLIVLRDEGGHIVGWTDFHKYARGGKKRIARSINAGHDRRCLYVTKLLNYVFFDKYHIRRLTDITADMVREFVQDYGMCRLPNDTEDTHRSEETVNICISTIMDFLDLMIEDNPSCEMRMSELYRVETVFSRKIKKWIDKKVPIFEVNYKPSDRTIFRDMPEGAFTIIMDEIVANHTNILMLAACSAFAGMRPSEACNVRRQDSPLGPGLIFELIDGEVVNVTIDLQRELNLRSDLVNVGSIKKKRKQKVYHAFLEAFIDCYNVYMKYIENHPYETAYGALTNTRSGRAYTYASYVDEFKRVVEECIPIMLASDDPQTVNYGHLLLENSIGPHVFRHWFSVKLVLYGEDAATLKNWRGDKRIESALTYLANKSELERQHKIVQNEAFNYMLWRASKVKEKKVDRTT